VQRCSEKNGSGQAKPKPSGNEQSESPDSRRKPSVAMVRRPGLVLSDKLYQRRLALGWRGHVEGGTWSEHVLFLHGRREGRGGGLRVCLNCEDEEKGLERALPIIAEAITAGRLAAWVDDRCEADKVRTLRTTTPQGNWAKVAAEVRRLAVLAVTDCQIEIATAARRLHQPPWLLDLFVKFARDQRRRWERAPRFMKWVSAPGGKRVLESNVNLSGGSRLTRRLNTDDRKVAGPRRLRLLLWHAIAKGQLPGGVEHDAWRLHGGKIPEEIKRLQRWLRALPWRQYELHREPGAERLGYHASTVDWLTDHEETRRQNPVRRARVDATLRSRHRHTNPTPISRSWQFSRVGGILHKNKQSFYGRLTIGHFVLEWTLGLTDRAEAEACVKSAIDARKRVRDAARNWRECQVGSREATIALTALLNEQRRFRYALLALGAKRSKSWAEAVKVLKEPPSDYAPRADRCIRWFVELLLKNPERPPRPVETLLKEADTLFGAGGRGARRCYETAQEKTGNRNWSRTRRPPKSAA
jgi:hypothetical protein